MRQLIYGLLPARVPHVYFFLKRPWLLRVIQFHLLKRSHQIRGFNRQSTYLIEVLFYLCFQCFLGRIPIYLVCRGVNLLLVERHRNLLFAGGRGFLRTFALHLLR